MDNRPIGFMDSGVGGLSVVKIAHQKLPNEEVVFIGDEANMPYGPRSTEEVIKLARHMAHFLIKKNAKAIVIACNTATTAAYHILKEELDVPVIGVIEPGSLSATKTTKNNKVGIIATKGTIKSDIYPKTIHSINHKIDTYPLACQDFVQIVENNAANTKETQELVDKQMADLQKNQIDTLVLGCTHFPLLEKPIQKAFGDKVKLVDPGVETVHQLNEVLKENDMYHDPKVPVHDHYYVTAHAKSFSEIGKAFLNEDVTAQLVNIEND